MNDEEKPIEGSGLVVVRREFRRSEGGPVEVLLYLPVQEEGDPDVWVCRGEIVENGQPPKATHGHGVDGLQALLNGIKAVRHALQPLRSLTWFDEVGELGLPLIIDDRLETLEIFERLIELEYARMNVTWRAVDRSKPILLHAARFGGDNRCREVADFLSQRGYLPAPTTNIAFTYPGGGDWPVRVAGQVLTVRIALDATHVGECWLMTVGPLEAVRPKVVSKRGLSPEERRALSTLAYRLACELHELLRSLGSAPSWTLETGRASGSGPIPTRA